MAVPESSYCYVFVVTNSVLAMYPSHVLVVTVSPRVFQLFDDIKWNDENWKEFEAVGAMHSVYC